MGTGRMVKLLQEVNIRDRSWSLNKSLPGWEKKEGYRTYFAHSMLIFDFDILSSFPENFHLLSQQLLI